MMQSRSHEMSEQAPDSFRSDDRFWLSDPRNQELHPLVDFLYLLLFVFAAEALVMLALAVLPKMSTFPETIADSLLLTLILAPLLWRVMVLPLRKAGRFRGLVEQSLVGIYIIDGGRLLYANPRAEEIFGCAAGELAGVSVKTLVADDDWRATEREIRRLVSGELPVARFEFRARRKDGRDVMIGAQGLRTHVDGRRAIIGVMQDITEHKRAEEALQQSQERFRILFEQAADSILLLEILPEGIPVIRNANSATFKLLGYERDELIGQPVSFIEALPDASKVIEKRRRDVLSGKERVFEARHRCKDGTIRDFECSATEMQIDSKTFAISVERDITERKRAEGTLRLQSAALNAAANAMIITGATGTLEWINAAFTRLTGYSAEEAIGRNPRELVKSGVHDRAFYKAMWDTILAGDVWRGEVTNRRKDGSLYPEELTITPVKNDRGEVAHFIAIKRDLTEQHQLEAQFLQAQKMETVGRLAGGIAHDFNNLLTVINGTAELASMDLREDDPLRAEFEEIRRAGDRAAALTRQLLAFSRKQIMKLEVVNLSTRVADLQGMLQRLIGEHIALVVRPGQDLGNVMADPVQIEQVVMNLAVNARDAMPNGGTLIIETRDVALDAAYAATHPSVQPGPHVMLAISDTGVGMDEATRARIFEPFFTTKGPGKGTGLGLSTVYGIVKQSGGSIWVYSELGKGTTFKIYLPRVEAVAPHGQPAPTITSGHGAETILIVEDEEAVQHLARRVLQSAGYTVLTASTGVEALRILERHDGPVHLVLTDMIMPGMSGRDLVARLEDIRPRMKVLYTSGYTDEAISHHGLLDGAACFIGKPYAAAELTRKVRDVLDSSDGR